MGCLDKGGTYTTVPEPLPFFPKRRKHRKKPADKNEAHDLLSTRLLPFPMDMLLTATLLTGVFFTTTLLWGTSPLTGAVKLLSAAATEPPLLPAVTNLTEFVVWAPKWFAVLGPRLLTWLPCQVLDCAPYSNPVPAKVTSFPSLMAANLWALGFLGLVVAIAVFAAYMLGRQSRVVYHRVIFRRRNQSRHMQKSKELAEAAVAKLAASTAHAARAAKPQ